MGYKSFLIFSLVFLLVAPVSSKDNELHKPFRPNDSIPDKKDYTIAKDGRAVRKGTFKSFVDNVFLLDVLIQLPKGEVRTKKITSCAEALKEIAQDLYSIGIFDRIFTIKEWLQDDQKISRIIATLACAQVFVHKLSEKDTVLLKEQLHNIKSKLKMPEIHELVNTILGKLEK
jgi:hypothetical protein